MPGIRDITIVDSNTCEAKPSESGTVKVLCSPDSCGSTNLTVFRRHVASGRQLALQAGSDYHLVYVISAAAKGTVRFKGETHEAEDGAGVLLGLEYVLDGVVVSAFGAFLSLCMSPRANAEPLARATMVVITKAGASLRIWSS